MLFLRPLTLKLKLSLQQAPISKVPMTAVPARQAQRSKKHVGQRTCIRQRNPKP